jgi:hypothetical protein
MEKRTQTGELAADAQGLPAATDGKLTDHLAQIGGSCRKPARQQIEGAITWTAFASAAGWGKPRSESPERQDWRLAGNGNGVF